MHHNVVSIQYPRFLHILNLQTRLKILVLYEMELMTETLSMNVIKYFDLSSTINVVLVFVQQVCGAVMFSLLFLPQTPHDL